MTELCTVCGLPIDVGDYPCIVTARPHQRGINGAIGDECDFWQENGTRQPIHFTHKSEFRRWLDVNNYENKVCNAGVHDTIVPRWSMMDPQTLKNAEILASRNGSARAGDDAPEPSVPMTWTIREWES